jgi:hypothetical protein
MNCLDCASNDRATSAVGVCHDCGAGVCLDHAISRDRHLTRIMALNMEVEVQPSARILRCGVCAAAVDAVAGASRATRRHRSKKARH